MSININVQINGSFAVYQVSHEIDGIYIAKLIRTAGYEAYSYPEKIFLHKNNDGWKTDHYQKEVGQILGGKIEERLKEF